MTRQTSTNFLKTLTRENLVDARDVLAEVRRRRWAMIVVALLHVLTLGVGVTIGAAFFSGCSEPRDELTTIDGGTNDAPEDDGIFRGSVGGTDGDRADGGRSAEVGGAVVPVDAGAADASRLGDAADVRTDVRPDDAGLPGRCRVVVELERCGSTDVYRCRVVSDDPTLTADLHVSGCSAPDGTACARCCPGEPAYVCPAVLP